jgi:hypothetical protein
MIDPVWLQGVQGARLEARVHHHGVTLNGIHLRFIAPYEDCPAEGTVMVAWLERNFRCATKAELAGAVPEAQREPELATRN